MAKKATGTKAAPKKGGRKAAPKTGKTAKGGANASA